MDGLRSDGSSVVETLQVVCVSSDLSEGRTSDEEAGEGSEVTTMVEGEGVSPSTTYGVEELGAIPSGNLK